MMVGRVFVFLVLTGACQFGNGVGGFTTNFIHSGLCAVAFYQMASNGLSLLFTSYTSPLPLPCHIHTDVTRHSCYTSVCCVGSFYGGNSDNSYLWYVANRLIKTGGALPACLPHRRVAAACALANLTTALRRCRSRSSFSVVPRHGAKAGAFSLRRGSCAKGGSRSLAELALRLVACLARARDELLHDLVRAAVDARHARVDEIAAHGVLRDVRRRRRGVCCSYQWSSGCLVLPGAIFALCSIVVMWLGRMSPARVVCGLDVRRPRAP